MGMGGGGGGATPDQLREQSDANAREAAAKTALLEKEQQIAKEAEAKKLLDDAVANAEADKAKRDRQRLALRGVGLEEGELEADPFGVAGITPKRTQLALKQIAG